MDVLESAQWAVEHMECDDWEVGPFDGHCLRLTCKRCIFDRAVKELALARPVVAIFAGTTWTKRGDEMCVYTTADDIGAIRRAVSHRPATDQPPHRRDHQGLSDE
jgi:hypothetical protein